jgi:hypothetical protein
MLPNAEKKKTQKKKESARTQSRYKSTMEDSSADLVLASVKDEKRCGFTEWGKW